MVDYTKGGEILPPNSSSLSFLCFIVLVFDVSADVGTMEFSLSSCGTFLVKFKDGDGKEQEEYDHGG